MTTEGKGPIVIPCYLVDGVPYVLEVDANGKLAMRAAEIETLLAGGLPAALDGLSLKVKEQSPISGFATQTTLAALLTELEAKLETGDLSITASKELVVLLRALKGAVETSLICLTGGELQTYPHGVPKSERVSNLSAAAGYNVLSTTAVPAGKIHKLTSAAGLDASNAITLIVITAMITGSSRLDSKTAPIALDSCNWSGGVLLGEGDNVSCEFYGCVAGDGLYFDISFEEFTL